MLKPLTEILKEKRDKLVDEWAWQIKAELKPYAGRTIKEMESTTSDHMDAIIECVESGEYEVSGKEPGPDTKLMIFLKKLTNFRAQMGFTLSDTLEAFLVGWNLLTRLVFKYYASDMEELIKAHTAVDASFRKTLIYYAMLYHEQETARISEESARLAEKEQEIKHRLSLVELEEEKKKSEEFLDTILGQSVDAIIGLDANDNIISWNKGAEAIFGYTEDEILGNHFKILLTPELIQSGELEEISRLIREHGYIKDFITHRKTKDGRKIMVNLTRTVLRDENGKIRWSSAIIRDVTEQKKIEQQMMQAEKLATIGQLTAGIAHEIGTPLNIISGRAELALDGLPKVHSVRESLEAIIHQSERITKLIRNLLMYSRKEAMSLKVVDINKKIMNMLGLLSSAMAKNGVSVKTHLDTGIPSIKADENTIDQVLMNLFMNAIQAMPDKGNLVVSTSLANSGLSSINENQVVITIEDTGMGIAEENIGKIFEPFFTTKESGKGTGLGLAIVERVVRDHGGDISVKSELGKGTTFTVSIPVLRAEGLN